MRSVLAPAPYVSFFHPLKDLTVLPALWSSGKGRSTCWRILKPCKTREESAGPMKQELLGCVLLLETCQKGDKCRSAISKLYSPAVSRERAFPLPSCAGVEVNFQCSGSTNKLMFNIIITSSSRGSF